MTPPNNEIQLLRDLAVLKADNTALSADVAALRRDQSHTPRPQSRDAGNSPCSLSSSDILQGRDKTDTHLREILHK